MQNSLHLEDLLHDAGPSLSVTRLTLGNVLCVLGRNDILASLGVVHLGLLVREKPVKEPVENARSDERVEIANIEKFLATSRDRGRGRSCSGRGPARYDNAVDEAGERGNAADEESRYGAPVGSEFGRVAVYAVEVVHVGYGNVSASDDVVVSHENACHGTEENGVTAEESKELCGRCENFPWNETPATNDGSEKLTTANVDVLGGERH